MGTNHSTPTSSPSPSRIRRADATDSEDATAAGRPYFKCNNWGDVRIVKCDRALDDWLRDDFPNHQLCKVLGPARALFLAAPLRLGTVYTSIHRSTVHSAHMCFDTLIKQLNQKYNIRVKIENRTTD